MSTVRDVARLAGVSSITVSRVINNSDYVSKATRERVEKAIEELNYIPNALATSFRSKRTDTVALVVTDVTNPFWTTVARGVEDVAVGQDLSVILCNTDENPEKESRYIGLLLRRQVDGILIAPATDDGERLLSIRYQGIPCVLLDRKVKQFASDVVRCDSVAGAHKLTRHLLDMGHRRIAMISGPASVSTAEDRVEGYRQALQEQGVAVDENLIRRGEFKQSSGYRLMEAIMADGLRPSAVFAATNFIAIGVMEAAMKAGLRVPEDIALVCFDDIPLASHFYPFLTIVAQPAYEIGTKAMELLLEQLSGNVRCREREVVLETELIVRESCGQYLRTLPTSGRTMLR